MCVFSLVLAYVNVYTFMCICMFLYVYVFAKGVHICVTVNMCRQGVGVSCVLVCRRSRMLSRLQLGPNCNSPCPVQKTGASHLQAKWLYPGDANLHRGQQQHEQQGDETGYRHAHRAWLSIRTGSTWYF